MNFYSNDLSNFFRLGDVIQGFTRVIPKFTQNGTDKMDLNIELVHHDLFVILSPCCSIEDKEAHIVPLKQISDTFLKSNYTANDFSIINNPMSRKEVIGDLNFKNVQPDKQIEFENAPKTFEFVDKFVFAGHDLLDKYTIVLKRKNVIIESKETNSYIISFKDMIKVKYSQFDREAKDCKKLLELTPFARNVLRDKMVHFFSRIPDEDKEYLI